MALEKINASRFCDLQGIPDFERRIIERKWRGQLAYYHEWYATMQKEGFELGDQKNIEGENTPENKNK